jgi:hypothetical protein
MCNRRSAICGTCWVEPVGAGDVDISFAYNAVIRTECYFGVLIRGRVIKFLFI